MLKNLIMCALLLSIAVLLAAAFISPAQLQAWLPQQSSTDDSGLSAESKGWCEMMEEKPNQQWQEGEFQRFASECLE